MQKITPAIMAELRAGTFTGALSDLSNYDYHSLEKYWSSTQLKYLLSNSPKHFYERYITKSLPAKSQTLDQALGSACHCLLLTPSLFEDEFLIMPELNLRTKDGREQRDQTIANNPTKIILKDETHAEARRIVASVVESPELMSHLQGSVRELSLFWKCPFFGVMFRARLDGFKPDTASTLIEYKTAANGDPESFTRQIDDLHYDLSLSHYTQGIKNVLQVPVDQARFIVSESSEPYVASTYLASDYLREIGHAKWMDACSKLEIGLNQKKWPGYTISGEEMQLTPTPWAMKKWGLNGI